MKIKIRPAMTKDAGQVKKCAENAYDLYVDRIGRKPPPMISDFAHLITEKKVHILEVDDKIAGFIIIYSRDDHLHIENVAIDPSTQGKGYGKKLVDFAEAEALARGCSAVELYTHQKMVENISYYPKLGYQEIDRHDRDGMPRVFFRKEL